MIVAENITEQQATARQIEADYPDLPPICEAGGVCAPAPPTQLDEMDISSDVLRDLAVKLAQTTPNFTTTWVVEQLCLPMQLAEELFWRLKQDRLVEVLGQEGPFNYRYASTKLGCEFAARLNEISAYVGPAPVSLAAYSAMIRWQQSLFPPASLAGVREALGDLVLPAEAVTVAALAAASGRSLFLFGPAGNGKTSMGQMLHNVAQGDIWIPYCIAAGDTVIRVFDPECHEKVDRASPSETGNIDRRWVRIRRPLLVAGGEMTLEEMDLSYSPALRFYESPPHLKANCGTFLIDDFGRQRVEPHELLNRWIVPLERQVDFLTLRTGQKIQVPFRMMLIVATNLTVSDIADPAFLRRMGYRLHLERPDERDYAEILRRYAARVDVEISDMWIAKVLQRYETEGRELRCSEPRDLIERARDICSLHERSFELTEDVLDLAWKGYFGNTPPRDEE